MRSAIIEYNWYHDEVLPTVVYLLNQLGLSPDVYWTRHASRKDAFAYAGELDCSFKLIDGGFGTRALRGTPSRLSSYDFVVLNSIEPDDVLERAAEVREPAIAIVHNASRITSDVATASFFADSRHAPMLLARHVSERTGLAVPPAWIAPVFLGSLSAATASVAPISRLCVQGNVEFARRDYLGLVDTASQLAQEGLDFIVDIVGRSDTRDGATFKTVIEQRGMQRRFTFTEGEVPYRSYLERIAVASFLLPLLDSTTKNQSLYFEDKISSTISMAIGMGVPPIADEQVVSMYGLESASVSHSPGALADGIRRALSMSDSDRRSLRQGLASERTRLLSQSLANMRAALSQIGVVLQEQHDVLETN